MLTTGSHATAILRSPDFDTAGAEGLLRAWATGMRMRTEVSESTSSRSEIVCVCTGRATMPTARSALAARLISISVILILVAVSRALTVSCGPRESSRPNANWTTPHVSETALAAKTPLYSCDMLRSPLAPRRSRTQRERNSLVLKDGYHLTVFKKYSGGRNDSGQLCVIPAAGYPPCPLTGDVGRGCGDATRALLFCQYAFLPICNVSCATDNARAAPSPDAP